MGVCALAPQLRFPFEFARVQDRIAHKSVDNVACVHVDDDEGVDLLAAQLGQVGVAHLQAGAREYIKGRFD